MYKVMLEYKPNHTALLSLVHRHTWWSQHEKNCKLLIAKQEKWEVPGISSEISPDNHLSHQQLPMDPNHVKKQRCDIPEQCQNTSKENIFLFCTYDPVGPAVLNAVCAFNTIGAVHMSS